MGVLLFPDNTVLVNFAILSRIDLLERLANGHGRWCATVARECGKSAQQPGLGALGQVSPIFGEPWRPDPAEHQDALVLRDELARPEDPRNQHMGEAETLAIMTRRNVNGFFVTDDKGAARLAHKHDIQVATTWSLLRVSHRTRLVADADTIWGYVQTLGEQHRGRPPGVYDRTTFDAWVQSA